MRDIKFRAWLKDDKRMVEVRSIDFHEEGNIITVNYNDIFGFEFNENEIELMQYTGLKNKNAALKIKVRAWEIQGKKYKKVIDILKSKKVDLVILLSSNDFREYNANITIRINGVTYLKGNNYTLTQQEYDLLKEVLESV